MSTHHTFDIQIATEFKSTEVAIVFHHIQYWTEVNSRRKKNFFDGQYWMYQTLEEMASHFPYLSKDQVKRNISKLVDAGWVIKGNFNRTQFDRTVWYSVNQKVFTKWRNRQMDESVSPDGKDDIATPIPDTKTDTETDKKKNKKKEPVGSDTGGGAASSQHALRLSSLLFEKISENDPRFKKPNLDTWAQEIDRMIRIDKRTPEEIEALICFATSDEFWQTNVLSPQKLRKQASRLFLQMRKAKPQQEKETATESRYKASQMYAEQMEDLLGNHIVKAHANHAMVFLNGKGTPISYTEHGFQEQLDSLLRKKGVL